MDPGRRRLLLTLALVPALPAASRGAAPVAEGTALLRASAGPVGGTTPLRYGDPPPVLRVLRGEPMRISLDNRLPGPTSLDLHGLRVPPPLGGSGPFGGSVAPGATAEITAVPPDAGTFWFHPWLLDPGMDATAQGLSGVLVVEEPTPPEVDADLVAILGDRALPRPADSIADAMLIDGDAFPRRATLRPGSRVRLRVVNGSTRQAVVLRCAGASPAVVAIDGHPSTLFRPRGDAVPMGPGARYDLMIDMPGGPGAEVTLSVGAAGIGGTALVLRAEGEPREPRGPVAALPPNPLLPAAIALERATRATLVAARLPGSPESWSVNGASGFSLPKAPLFRAERGSPVTLTLRNAGPDLVAFRVHGFALRVLHDLDDGWEPYWRDTVLVQPGATHHAAFVADLPGRWPIESPFFAQAAGGLRHWFEII